MLVLTRKKNESIIINDDIEITVIQIEGDQIKLGINAPKQVNIYRKEVFLMIQNENKQAAEQKVSIETVENLQKLLQQKRDN